MTSSLKTRGPIRLAGAAPSDRGPHVPAAIPAAVTTQAATVRTRRGQTISLTLDGSEALYFVRSGVLMVDVTLPDDLRQVVGLLYPGDVLRVRWAAFTGLAAEDPEIARYVDDAVAKQTARQAIHMAAVGRFDCRQRVATFLLELALRIGIKAPCGGVEFEMPLRRTDMADYLGLNADTLSRTMSRLRATGLLSHPERHRALVRDFEALTALTPAAQSLMALYGNASSSNASSGNASPGRA
jgi:CRP/FNR family transcriptional regulator, anaerobic regulatory protein